MSKDSQSALLQFEPLDETCLIEGFISQNIRAGSLQRLLRIGCLSTLEKILRAHVFMRSILNDANAQYC